MLRLDLSSVSSLPEAFCQVGSWERDMAGIVIHRGFVLCVHLLYYLHSLRLCTWAFYVFLSFFFLTCGICFMAFQELQHCCRTNEYLDGFFFSSGIAGTCSTLSI